MALTNLGEELHKVQAKAGLHTNMKDHLPYEDKDDCPPSNYSPPKQVFDRDSLTLRLNGFLESPLRQRGPITLCKPS